MTLRVLTISKPYVAAAYRDKLRLMAQDSRFEVGLVCPTDWAGQAFEVATTQLIDHYFSVQLPICLNGSNHLHFYRGLEEVIRRFKPDVLNVEEEHYSIVTWQAFRLALKYGVKPMFYTWQNIEKRYPPPFRQIEHYVFRHSLAAVVGNAEAGEILRKKGFKGLIENLPQMGVNEELYPVTYRSKKEKDILKKAVGLDPSIPWIMYCGRLVEEKGITTLLKAVATLGQTLPHVGLVVMGNGPQARELQDQARELSDAVTVKFVSFIPSSAVPAWMGAVDILCLPSLTRRNWKEQFGRVLVEAMASSTVVVGSNSGEIPHVIKDAGLVFPEGDSVRLSECLATLIQQPLVYEGFKTKALEYVRTQYTNKVIARRLCDLIWDEYHRST